MFVLLDPRFSFSSGLRPINYDADMLKLIEDISGFNLVDMYVKHEVNNPYIIDEADAFHGFDVDDDVQDNNDNEDIVEVDDDVEVNNDKEDNVVVDDKVEVETKNSWEWFINLLIEGMQAFNKRALSFISDQQKVKYNVLSYL